MYKICFHDLLNTSTCCPLQQGFKSLHSLCMCARVCVCVSMCIATDAGSVAQSHLTREERVRDAAEERERGRGEEKEGGVVPGEREGEQEGESSVLNPKQHGIRCCAEQAGRGI